MNPTQRKREHERDERIAAAFHDAYERLAPDFGYRTRAASAVPWEDVPYDNKRLMRAVVRDLIQKGVIYEHGVRAAARDTVQLPEVDDLV